MSDAARYALGSALGAVAWMAWLVGGIWVAADVVGWPLGLLVGAVVLVVAVAGPVYLAVRVLDRR